MSESQNILKGSIIYAIGNFGSKILSFALVSIFSFYLSKTEYGLYDFILTCIAFLVPLITMQIGDAVYRELFDYKDEGNRSKIISSAIVYVLLAFVAGTVLFVIITSFFEFKFKTEFIFLLFFSCTLPIMQQTARGLGKRKLYAMAGILNTLLLVLLCVIFLIALKKGIQGLLYAATIAYCITTLVLFFKADIYRYFSLKSVPKSTIKSLVNYSAPLVPNTISWFLITMSDRFIILYWLTMADNGIYAVSSKYPSLIMMINSVFILAIQDHAIDGKGIFNSKFFETYVKFNFTLINIFVLASPLITEYTLAADFYEAWQYMPLLFISAGFMAFSSYLGAYYLKTKNTKGLFHTTMLGATINVLLSAGLMPVIGLYAPALGSLLSFGIVYLLRYHYLKNAMNININHSQMLILSILSIGCMGLLYIKNEILTFILVALSISMFMLYNKKLLKYVYSNTKYLILKK